MDLRSQKAKRKDVFVINFWFRIASGLMFLSVVFGSFGAHALKKRLAPEMLEIYRVAGLHHIIYSLSLFVIAWAVSANHPKANAAGWVLLAGMLFFCGSLYGMALTGIKGLGAVTPIGGVLFMIGWGLLALG